MFAGVMSSRVNSPIAIHVFRTRQSSFAATSLGNQQHVQVVTLSRACDQFNSSCNWVDLSSPVQFVRCEQGFTHFADGHATFVMSASSG